jgi:hypothetical protein
MDTNDEEGRLDTAIQSAVPKRPLKGSERSKPSPPHSVPYSTSTGC